MKLYQSFEKFIQDASDRLQHHSYLVNTGTWQSIDISNKPEMVTSEILNFSGQMFMPSTQLQYYRDVIKPNYIWADRHFELERISREPINPGITWKEWPWGHSADKFRTEGEQFSHSYAERYWPKWAGLTEGGVLNEGNSGGFESLRGIRYHYGDLDDLIKHLIKHPLSRQAYLPVWFPEDTGTVDGQRVPCSLGYHFMRRGDSFHIWYGLRSCDFYRHFRDDIYLTVRLLLWVLDQLRIQSPENWASVRPGMYSMTIMSLHLFVNDRKVLYGPEDRIPGRV